MPKVLIIGCGNALRGDDAVGWLAAHSLSQEFTAGAPQVIASHQLTPEMAEPISQSDLVIFIDAAADLAAGERRWTRLSGQTAERPSLTHHVSPAGLLASARMLYGHCPDAWMASIGAASFAFGEGLSPSVQASLSLVLEEIRRLVQGQGHEIINTHTCIDQ
jgi:hydrogenase maturation protease